MMEVQLRINAIVLDQPVGFSVVVNTEEGQIVEHFPDLFTYLGAVTIYEMCKARYRGATATDQVILRMERRLASLSQEKIEASLEILRSHTI